LRDILRRAKRIGIRIGIDGPLLSRAAKDQLVDQRSAATARVLDKAKPLIAPCLREASVQAIHFQAVVYLPLTQGCRKSLLDLVTRRTADMAGTVRQRSAAAERRIVLNIGMVPLKIGTIYIYML
jgi:hypothetical protein